MLARALSKEFRLRGQVGSLADRHVARISPRGGGAAPQKGPLPSVQRAPSDSPKGPFSLTRGPSDLHRGPLNVHGALWSFREGPDGPKDL